MIYLHEVNTETVGTNGDDLYTRVSCWMTSVLLT